MPINHTKVHYAIGVAALGLGLYGATARNVPHNVVIAPPGQAETMKPSHHAWQGIGQAKTIALGDALAEKVGKVTIYCASPDCRALELDLDDAMQIAGWKASFEDRQVDSEQDIGLFVGPPGKAAEELADTIGKTTGIKPVIVGIDGSDGTGIIIGKSGN